MPGDFKTVLFHFIFFLQSLLNLEVGVHEKYTTQQEFFLKYLVQGLLNAPRTRIL